MNDEVKMDSDNNAVEDSALLADMAKWPKNEGLDSYSEQVQLAVLFPGLEERCISMGRMRIKPEPDINTGALSGDLLYESGAAFLTAIKKEIFDVKPKWEKDWIKEGRISGERLEDESFEDDGITPQDGRPPLTVEYLRSIGYDIDIS